MRIDPLLIKELKKEKDPESGIPKMVEAQGFEPWTR